jgi:hypothetical protein
MHQHHVPQLCLRSNADVRRFISRVRTAWRKSRRNGGAYSVYGTDGSDRAILEIRVHVRAALLPPIPDAETPLLAAGRTVLHG